MEARWKILQGDAEPHGGMNEVTGEIGKRARGQAHLVGEGRDGRKGGGRHAAEIRDCRVLRQLMRH